MTKKFYSLNQMKHSFFLVQELLPRHYPQQVSEQIVNWNVIQ